MPTIRHQVIDLFATKINASRGLRFVDQDPLPMRSVWDIEEEAQKTQYGKYDVTLSVQVQIILDARGSDSEGAALDAALGDLQLAALRFNGASDQAFFELINGIEYTGAQYAYSEDGSDLIGLSASFLIRYSFLNTNPSQQS